MNHRKNAIAALARLREAIRQLDDDAYGRELAVLTGNSIGKHARHIIEFYRYLLSGYPEGIVNYDQRRRDPALERHVEAALAAIDEICGAVAGLPDKPLTLSCVDPGGVRDHGTTFHRELLYVSEHAVHHMAIIRIAVRQEKMAVTLDDGFGVAASTLRYRESQCAR